MNTNEIRQHLLSRAKWVDLQTTVDTVKAGDPTKPVRKVGVGWAGSIENLRAAAKNGCDLFITHEPLFWNHYDDPADSLRTAEPCLTKMRLLEETGMVVLRCHDAWDNWPVIGIRDSWADWLGLTKFLAEDATRLHALYEIPPVTLRQFAAHVAGRILPLGEDSVSVMGDGERIVSHPALGVGCSGPREDMIALGADVLIVCYDGASYWQNRQRLAELGVGVIAVEHGTSEMPGIMNLAKYLKETFTQLEVYSIDLHTRTWTVNGK